jgi:predicted dehydrogenase
MAKTLNIGVVGCGAHAQIAHLPYFKKNSSCNLIALCDTDPRKLDSLASKYNVPKRFQDFQEIVGDKEIDTLVIAAPTYLHAPMTITAMKYGKNVLCENPMAMTLKEAGEMLRVAKRTGRKLIPAMNNRLRPDVQILKKFIREGELGEIYYAKTGWLIGSHEWVLSAERLQSISSSGGAFLSLGVHLLDIALFLLSNKEPVTIFGSLHRKEPAVHVEDTAMCTVCFSDETLLTIEVGWSLLFEKDFLYCNVFGDKGAALLNPLKIQKELHNELFNVTPTISHKKIYRTSYELQTQYLVDCLIGKKKPVSTKEDALKLAEITEAFYKSARMKRLIHV